MPHHRKAKIRRAPPKRSRAALRFPTNVRATIRTRRRTSRRRHMQRNRKLSASFDSELRPRTPGRPSRSKTAQTAPLPWRRRVRKTSSALDGRRFLRKSPWKNRRIGSPDMVMMCPPMRRTCVLAWQTVSRRTRSRAVLASTVRGKRAATLLQRPHGAKAAPVPGWCKEVEAALGQLSLRRFEAALGPVGPRELGAAPQQTRQPAQSTASEQSSVRWPQTFRDSQAGCPRL